MYPKHKPPCEPSNSFSLSLLILHPTHTHPLNQAPHSYPQAWLISTQKMLDSPPAQPITGLTSGVLGKGARTQTAQESGKWQWDVLTGPAPRLALTALILVRRLGLPDWKLRPAHNGGYQSPGLSTLVGALPLAVPSPGLFCVNLYFLDSCVVL